LLTQLAAVLLAALGDVITRSKFSSHFVDGFFLKMMLPKGS